MGIAVTKKTTTIRLWSANGPLAISLTWLQADRQITTGLHAKTQEDHLGCTLANLFPGVHA